MISLRWLFLWTRTTVAGAGHRPLPIASLRGEVGFVSLDLETTGLDPKTDAIVAAAVVPFVGGEARPALIDALVNPGRPIPPSSQQIHGITDAMVRDAVAAPAIVGDLLRACAERVVVGHSVAFDLAVVNRCAHAYGLAPLAGLALDVGRLARVVHPGWGHPSLEQLARHFGISTDGRHTAAGDARIAGEAFVSLLERLERRGARTVADLLRLQRLRR